jgi:UDP-N-acetylmuramoyl-tripeptide--D-alanyl-D-alanine ligase
MEPISLPDVIAAVGGRWRGPGEPPPLPVVEVSTDSRAVRPGALFVALRGSRVDGRRFVGQAIERGAVAALVDGGGTDGGGAAGLAERLIEVPDALQALARLAAHFRDASEAERIAITGTVGKTTTKEFVGALLEGRHPTVRAPRSFNNLLGVSLTLLLADRRTRFIVCEVGASAPGELARLSRLVRPSRAVVTEIGQAHLAGFGDLDGVVRAKSEVFDGLVPGGTAFLKEDAPGREKLEAAARAAGGRVVLFGRDRGDYRITACRRAQAGDPGIPAGEVPLGFRFEVMEPGGRREQLLLPLPGLHNVANALAAAAVARDAGLGWDEIREGMGRLHLPPLRFDVKRVAGVVVIDDTYNASVRSVRAALRETAEIPLPDRGRRFLVLGDLLELGDRSAEIHRGIGREVAESRLFEGLFTVGEESRLASGAALAVSRGRLAVRHFDRPEDVAPGLGGLLAPGDLVLFKASRGIGLERAAEEVRRRLRSGEQEGVRACSTISMS